jgi:hypothetical protein
MQVTDFLVDAARRSLGKAAARRLGEDLLDGFGLLFDGGGLCFAAAGHELRER